MDFREAVQKLCGQSQHLVDALYGVTQSMDTGHVVAVAPCGPGLNFVAHHSCSASPLQKRSINQFPVDIRIVDNFWCSDRVLGFEYQCE
jgi:hypothetical protein